MQDINRSVAVFLYGPPGSGKGTQAELLTENFGFFHFDSGDFLRRILHDPRKQKDSLVRRERALVDGGRLATPSWFLGAVIQYIESVVDRGESIVFSGAIRTLYEAFGDTKQKGLIPYLERSYGKQNLFFFKIDVSGNDSITRNSKRLICEICRSSLIPRFLAAKGRRCPLCAGKLLHRVDDGPKVVKVRLEEYHKRTKPIFDALIERSYRVIKIDGRPLPYKVHDKIIAHLTGNSQ